MPSTDLTGGADNCSREQPSAPHYQKHTRTTSICFHSDEVVRAAKCNGRENLAAESVDCLTPSLQADVAYFMLRRWWQHGVRAASLRCSHLARSAAPPEPAQVRSISRTTGGGHAAHLRPVLAWIRRIHPETRSDWTCSRHSSSPLQRTSPIASSAPPCQRSSPLLYVSSSSGHRADSSTACSSKKVYTPWIVSSWRPSWPTPSSQRSRSAHPARTQLCRTSIFQSSSLSLACHVSVRS